MTPQTLGTKRKCGLALACLGLLPALAIADPGYYVVTPYSQPGQLSLDARYWTVKPPDEEAVLWPEIGLRYGLNSRWTSELLLSYIGTSGGDKKLSSTNWQNSFLLTQGQQAFDLALHAQLIRNHNPGGKNSTALEFGPTLQTEWGLTQLNFNVFLDHDWGKSKGTQMKYQWQALRRLQAGLRLGVQGFGELGNWADWTAADRQSHRAGPTLRWALPLGNADQGLELQMAYLWGKVYGSQAEMFSAQLLYKF
ncbi:hypothetical protein LNV09_00155 [Paucibacter sp. B2R-40]|uniref:hypothetical protein n=1 Tax=Paucibacter sp. B2R-40 TaxID=2893554 RepID=UPI0021E44C05|nr:hypothetical protein [Paucibacter sp. B2R-40]MCV2352564.1 hypothetical protein [Paucibacter sp. B2R-40]